MNPHPPQPPPDLADDATLSYKGNRVRLTMETQATAPPAGPADSHMETMERGPLDALTELGAPALESEYRMVRRVASGGMGEVWEAVQISLGRVVAIKVVRSDRLRQQPGEASQGLFQEFRREAVFAARLEHPNILPVHDLGTDQQGAPMLAMKYVQGTPWDDALAQDFENQTAPQLIGKHLPILISVSQAVAFAHSRGVVHRDLKPSQVMLGEFGEVLLLDWGLAVFVGGEHQRQDMRRLGLPELEGNETATNPSGTPAMMAPEQTEYDAQRIGTWTDVYLLGGTLYFILTGSYPHEESSAEKAFVKASKGVVTPPGHCAPGRDIPRDLEELCLWALQPRPEDRCPSALKFIDALKDHLSGESRRRESMALTAEVESQLAGGAGDYQRFAACAARLEQAQGLWAGNPALPALRERVFAGHARLALHNGDLVLARLQADRLDEGPTRNELLGSVSLEEARALHRVRTRRMAIASTLALLGLTVVGGSVFTYKLRVSRDAEIEQRNVALQQRDLAADARGKSDEFARFVLKDMTDQLSSLERLDLLDPAMERAFEYYDSLPLDKLPAADRRSAAEGYLSVISAARLRGNSTLQQKAEAALAKLLDNMPREERSGPSWEEFDLRYFSEKERMKYRIGDVAGALEAGQRVVEISQRILARDPASTVAMGNVSDAYRELANIHAETSQTTESLRLSDLGIAFDERVLAQAPDDPTANARLVQSLRRKVVTLSRAPRSEDAGPTLHRLAALSRELSTRFPTSSGALSNASLGLNGLGEWHYTHGKSSDALQFNEEAMDILRKLAALDPGKPGTQSLMMNSLGTMMPLYQRLGKRDQAIATMREAIQVGEALLLRDPANIVWTAQMLAYLNNSVVLLLELRELDEADKLADRLLQLSAEHYERTPELRDSARSLCMAQLRKASVLMAKNQPADAIPYAKKGVELADQFAAEFPDSVLFRADRVSSRSWLSGAYQNNGDQPNASIVTKEVVELARENTIRTPTSRESWDHLATMLSSLSSQNNALGKLPESLQNASESVDAYRRVLELDPSRVSSMIMLAQSLQRFGDAASNQGRYEESAAAMREAMDLARRCIEIEPQGMRPYSILCSAALASMRTNNDNAFEAAAAEMLQVARDAAGAMRERVNLLDESQRLDADIQLTKVAISSVTLGFSDKALEDFRAIRESRSQDSTTITTDRLILCQVDDNEARALLELGHATKAEALSTSSTLELARLLEESPGMGILRSELAIACTTLASTRIGRGDWDGAMVAATQSEEIWRELVKAEPTSLRNSDALGRTLRVQGEILNALGRDAEAIPILEEAASLQRPSMETGSASGLAAWQNTQSWLAKVLVATGDTQRARAILDEVASTLNPNGDSDAARYCRDRLYWQAEAELRTALGDQPAARQAWEHIVLALTPRQHRPQPLRQRAHLAVALYRLGRIEEAKKIRDDVAKGDLKGAEILRVME